MLKIILGTIMLLAITHGARAQQQEFNLIYYNDSNPNGSHWIVDTTPAGNPIGYSYGACIDLAYGYQIQPGIQAACSPVTDYYGNPKGYWTCQAGGGYDTLSGQDYNAGNVAAFLNIVDQFSWYPTQWGWCVSSYDGEQLIAPQSWYYSEQ